MEIPRVTGLVDPESWNAGSAGKLEDHRTEGPGAGLKGLVAHFCTYDSKHDVLIDAKVCYRTGPGDRERGLKPDRFRGSSASRHQSGWDGIR